VLHLLAEEFGWLGRWLPSGQAGRAGQAGSAGADGAGADGEPRHSAVAAGSVGRGS